MEDAKHSICIVDDDKTSCLIPKTLLERNDYLVHVFHTAENALQALDEVSPDLILLDVILPSMSGIELCRLLRANEQFKYIPIVMMTGLEEYSAMIQAYDAGANDFVLKPVDWRVLTYRIRYMLSSNKAVQGLHLAYEKIQSHQRQLEAAYEIAGVGSWEYKATQDTVLLSHELKNLLKTEIDTCSLDEFATLFVEEDQATFKQRIKEAVLHKKRVDVQCLMRNEQGFIVLNHVFELICENGDEKVVGLTQDTTLMKSYEEQIHYLACYDNLTKLPNRSQLDNQVANAIEIADKNNTKFGFLFIDLDDFKKINDTRGHHVGDQYLVEISKRLTSICRNSDVVADHLLSNMLASRFGGDEFIIILQNISERQQIWKVADRIMGTLSKTVRMNGIELRTTCSIGASIYPDDGSSLDELLTKADLAMYSVKDVSTNSYAFYEEAMSIKANEKVKLESDLASAIEGNELDYFFQEQYCAESLLVKGAEVLVRWNHPELGYIPPSVFVELAERNGSISQIGYWLIKTLFEEISTQLDELPADFSFGINVSAQDFYDEIFVSYLVGLTHRFNIPSHHIDIEITESTIMRDMSAAINNMEYLTQQGFCLSLDDFGTGYSSFTYLKDFPINKLKIDKSLIDDLVENKKSQAIVKSIIEMSRLLGIKTVVEGVETAEQSQILTHMTCDLLQGYYLSKPHPVADLSELFNP